MLGKVVTVVVFVNTTVLRKSSFSYFQFSVSLFDCNFSPTGISIICLKQKCADIVEINFEEPLVSRRTIHVVYKSSSHFDQTHNSTVYSWASFIDLTR